MLVATMEKFPGIEFPWGDFLQRLHGDYGAEGLSSTTVYTFMSKERLAEFPRDGLCRKLVR